MKHIIVSAHRRSGTHYLTDVIVNNFGYKRATVDLDCLKDMTPRDIQTFKEEALGTQPTVFWTHAQKLSNIVTSIEDPSFSELVDNSINDMDIVYIYRDGRDVLTSYYDMKKPNHTLSTFISYSAPIWSENITNWISEDILKIKFEDLREDYINTVQKVSSYIGKDTVCPVVNVTLEKLEDKKDGVLYSDREFRKGIVGDHKNHFTEIDHIMFNKKCSLIMGELDYA